MMGTIIPFLLTVTCEKCNKDEMYCWCFGSQNWEWVLRVVPIVAVLVIIPVAVITVFCKNKRAKNNAK